jgi:hypothetical protein
MTISTEMHQILKLYLQGLSAYKIARKLNLDPPMVYASLKAAKKNFVEADKMIIELKKLGWPDKLTEAKKANRLQQRRTAAQAQVSETPARSEEIAIKLG